MSGINQYSRILKSVNNIENIYSAINKVNNLHSQIYSANTAIRAISQTLSIPNYAQLIHSQENLRKQLEEQMLFSSKAFEHLTAIYRPYINSPTEYLNLVNQLYAFNNTRIKNMYQKVDCQTFESTPNISDIAEVYKDATVKGDYVEIPKEAVFKPQVVQNMQEVRSKKSIKTSFIKAMCFLIAHTPPASTVASKVSELSAAVTLFQFATGKSLPDIINQEELKKHLDLCNFSDEEKTELLHDAAKNVQIRFYIDINVNITENSVYNINPTALPSSIIEENKN